MSFLDKYWESDLCLTKIKLNESVKELGFDVKNNKLTIATTDRTVYFADIPKQQTRYIEEAELKYF